MKRKNLLIIAAVATVLVLCGIIAYLAYRTNKAEEDNEQMKVLQELAEMDKLEMQNEYEEFARQYQELQTQINNDSLIAQLEKEQQRVQELQEELKRTKSNDAAEIMRLKKELATLREILRNYVMQIDSLNQLNQQLNMENQNLRTENAQAQQHISNLTTEKETLTDKVAIASQLDATGVSAFGKNKKGKASKKIKEVKRFQISFSISRNVTAQTGMKSVYVRIMTPTNEVLTQGGTFPFENRTLEYSIRKDIEYTGEEQAVTVYWDVNQTLLAGTYRADIFADGHRIGGTTFSFE
ncbi:MAG: hypothetical protein J5671_08900 [Bacteroidaceae bacterium]|nr:hypothetical protein [Bacteroidaceae bacterium]